LPAEKTNRLTGVLAISKLLERSVTQRAESLARIAETSSALLVFLRHAGCTFCREALADIAREREQIEKRQVRIVLVHMGDSAALDPLLDKHGLADLDRICDPDQELYQAFGLSRGTLRQLFGPKVWWRGFQAGILEGHGLGKPAADAAQMPGMFLLEKGVIASRFRHRSAADRPDYAAFCLKSGETS
jgi:hypothetical protein